MLLISAAAPKKAIGGSKIRSNLVKNSPILSEVHFSKFALCSTDFDELCRISTCILQTSHSPISAKLMWAVLKYEFFHLYILQKTLNAIFSNVVLRHCIDVSMFLKYRQHQCILKKTSMCFEESINIFSIFFVLVN